MAKIGLDLRFWRKTTGGLSRYDQNLLKELLKIDQENKYTAIITPPDQEEFDLHSQNLKTLVVPIPHYSLNEQTKFLKILKKQNFDLVHFANFNHPIFYKRPFIVTIHDLIMHLYPSGAQKRSRIRQFIYKKVMKDCRRAVKIIVPSQSTRQDLVKMLRFPENKIVVTTEGSEQGFRLHSDREIINVKERLNLPDCYLLYVSRWTAYKGLVNLLEAYRMIREKKFPDLGLVICGKPDHSSPEVEQLVRQSQRNNPKIITPGFVNDEELAAIYSAADVYVHPSFYEGFGIMILEAFASGVPVVTSNVSSLPEVSGTAAMLVSPHSPYQIANACLSILSDKNKAQEMVQKGLERVKKYSWAKMAEQTLEVYKETLAVSGK